MSDKHNKPDLQPPEKVITQSGSEDPPEEILSPSDIEWEKGEKCLPYLGDNGGRYIVYRDSQAMEFENMRIFFNGNSNKETPFNTDRPLNTPGGLGKEKKGNMQGTNILGCLEIDYS